MIEEPSDEAWSEYWDDLERRRYRNHLMRHPHPSDPDHPDPAEYGMEEQND